MTLHRIGFAFALAFSTPAVAAADFTDYAPVVSVTPIYERRAESRHDCFVDGASAPAAQRSVVAPVLGGVAGALIGSQVGRGSGRDTATAVGAVVGTVAADRFANPQSEGSIAGAAVGGAAGAVLGNQIGSGSGRTIATGAGAVAGAMAGDRIATGASRSVTQPVERCRSVDAGGREAIRGFRVVYRYNGRDIATTMPYDPGHTVRVAVGVVDGAASAAYENHDRARPVRPAETGYGYRH